MEPTGHRPPPRMVLQEGEKAGSHLGSGTGPPHHTPASHPCRSLLRAPGVLKTGKGLGSKARVLGGNGSQLKGSYGQQVSTKPVCGWRVHAVWLQPGEQQSSGVDGGLRSSPFSTHHLGAPLTRVVPFPFKMLLGRSFPHFPQGTEVGGGAALRTPGEGPTPLPPPSR